jgi:hypothetical protein
MSISHFLYFSTNLQTILSDWRRRGMFIVFANVCNGKLIWKLNISMFVTSYVTTYVVRIFLRRIRVYFPGILLSPLTEEAGEITVSLCPNSLKIATSSQNLAFFPWSLWIWSTMQSEKHSSISRDVSREKRNRQLAAADGGSKDGPTTQIKDKANYIWWWRSLTYIYLERS